MKKRYNIRQVCLAACMFVGLMFILNAGSPQTWQRDERANTTDEAVALYKKGMLADKAGDYNNALKYFQQANSLDKKNPDILNMLAHSQRKTGMIDEALDNYKKALSLRSKFPEAREYLGEAYIQAVLREIETLRGYGKEGAEQRRELIKEFKQAAANLR